MRVLDHRRSACNLQPAPGRLTPEQCAQETTLMLCPYCLLLGICPVCMALSDDTVIVPDEEAQPQPREPLPDDAS
jgi:hypothetical protein